MKLSTSSLVLQAYAWLAIPLIIWIAAWLRPLISIPLLLAIGAVLVYIFTRPKEELQPQDLKAVSIDTKYFISLLCILGLVLISGIGGYMYQNFGDHVWRNAVYHQLVVNPWPVNLGTEAEPSVLCYYFAFWLPAALTAKIFGAEAGWMMQTLYAFWGMAIVISFLFARFGGRARLLIVALLILFSGWDMAVFLIADPDNFWANPTFQGLLVNKELSSYFWHSNSIYTNLGNIYNSATIAIVGMTLMYFTRQNKKLLIFAYSLMFLGAPIPCTGLLPVMAVWTLLALRRTVTWQNAIGILIFIAVGLFFLSNNSPKESLGFPSIWKMAGLFAVFFIFEFGIYLPFIWNNVRRDVLFWALAAIMMLAPFIVVGHSGDFGWRAGMPFSMYMLYKVMETAAEIKSWKSVQAVLFAIFLCIGAAEPVLSYALVARRSQQTICHTHPADMPEVWPMRRDHLNTEIHNQPRSGYYDNFFADGQSVFTEYMMRK